MSRNAVGMKIRGLFLPIRSAFEVHFKYSDCIPNIRAHSCGLPECFDHAQNFRGAFEEQNIERHSMCILTTFWLHSKYSYGIPTAFEGESKRHPLQILPYCHECASNEPECASSASRLPPESKRIQLECTSNAVGIFRLSLECGWNAVGTSRHHRIAWKRGQNIEESPGQNQLVVNLFTSFKIQHHFIPYRDHSGGIRSTFEVHSKYLRCILFDFLDVRTTFGGYSRSVLTAFERHSYKAVRVFVILKFPPECGTNF